MLKKLLKISNMKRFTRWLDQTNVHHAIRDTYFDTPWLMWPNERKSIERRLESSHERDVFCINRSRLRPGWSKCYLRYEQFGKSQELLEYVRKRYARVLKKKMERKREQKNIEKSVREDVRNIG